jgi:hypothetical protein
MHALRSGLTRYVNDRVAFICGAGHYERDLPITMPRFGSSRLAIFFTAVALTVIRTGGQTPNGEDQKSRAKLNSWLADTMKDMQTRIEPKVIPIMDETIRQFFPGSHFYAVYLPRWPRAVIPPKQLSLETLICVSGDGVVEPIRNRDELRAFLARKLAGVTNEDRARNAALASLLLATAGAKSGPYQLKSPDIQVTSEGTHIIGNARASVHEPSRGNIDVRVEFGPDGRTTPNDIKIQSSTKPAPPE